jgi:hypothetical protein
MVTPLQQLIACLGSAHSQVFVICNFDTSFLLLNCSGYVVRYKDCDTLTVWCLSYTNFHVVSWYLRAFCWICNFVDFISLINLRCKGAVLSKLYTFCKFVTAVLNFYSNCYVSAFSTCLICVLEFIRNIMFISIALISIPLTELSQNTQSYYNWHSKDKYKYHVE